MYNTNNKIIGFTISRDEIDHSDVDIFSVGLTKKHFTHVGLHVYLWGIGDLDKCYLDTQRISLSFPLYDKLDDRNVIITLLDHGIVIENDWLGSIPVFYHEPSGKVSTLVHNVTPTEKVINPDGLYNFLDFGYSVFGDTLVQDVMTLRFNSSLTISSRSIEVNEKPECVNVNAFNDATSSESVINNIERYIHTAEQTVDGDIVIPTSGGYDSRFLNVAVQDKQRVRAFSYGISPNPAESYEVVKAQHVTEQLGIEWQQIVLGDFNKYIDDWYHLYGYTVHLHGMYHIEFFHKIREQLSGSSSLLSGIVGDAWSGRVSLPCITSSKDLWQIGYVHRLRIEPGHSLLAPTFQSRNKFLDDEQTNLQSSALRIITAMRTKMILLQYLMSLPDYFGLATWTPFLNLDLVSHMLRLPDEDKFERVWQQRYFKQHNVDAENQTLRFSVVNNLDLLGLALNPIPPIDSKSVGKYISPEYIAEVNRRYQQLLKHGPLKEPIRNVLLRKRFIGPTLKHFNVTDVDTVQDYRPIAILKPIELLMRDTSQQ